MYSKAEHFRELVEHELRCSQRYQRFSALVVGAKRTGRGTLADLCSELLRASDELLESESGVVIFMAEVDEQNALKALNRLKTRYAGVVDLSFGVAIYPRDGRKYDTLIEVAQRRLARERVNLEMSESVTRGGHEGASAAGLRRLQRGVI